MKAFALAFAILLIAACGQSGPEGTQAGVASPTLTPESAASPPPASALVATYEAQHPTSTVSGPATIGPVPTATSKPTSAPNASPGPTPTRELHEKRAALRSRAQAAAQFLTNKDSAGFYALYSPRFRTVCQVDGLAAGLSESAQVEEGPQLKGPIWDVVFIAIEDTKGVEAGVTFDIILDNYVITSADKFRWVLQEGEWWMEAERWELGCLIAPTLLPLPKSNPNPKPNS